ncbi:SAM-dependent methyltransferase [Photobacterium phosphoreum]|uniref:class I SAM-dependent methyltransferase n=1 Tax=Photobacterium phosphoreum TaxID=659 RepID=UPI000D16B2FE|nr:SAM-dependent methyltransferase [Photobacterium phosphoreum]PSW32296.1 SAM-dependent methyltransferase [Photobacterium phosphoreum]
MLRKKAIDFIFRRSELNKNHENNICSTPSKNRINDVILFIKQYLKNPKEIGSLIPSSNTLSKMMTDSIIGHGDTLIELGAGTGVFTKQIKLKFKDHKFYVFEKNTNFHENLLNIKNIDLYCDALDIINIIDKNKTKVSDVISGLPLRSIDNKISNIILSHAFCLLINGGQFIQFTYGLKSPISNNFLKEHNMVLNKKIYVIKNIPPATIYIYKKIL